MPVPRGTATEDGEDPDGAATPDGTGLLSRPDKLMAEDGEEAPGADPDGAAAPDGATPEADGPVSTPRADEDGAAPVGRGAEPEAAGPVEAPRTLDAAGTAEVVVAP